MASALYGLANRAKLAPGSVSWDEVHAVIARTAKAQGEWAGMPMPIKGMRMIIHPSYPFAERMSQTFDPEPSLRKCKSSDLDDCTELRNSWSSYRDGKVVEIWRDSKGFFFTHSPRQNQARLLIDTISAARSWDFAAEMRAVEALKRHLTDWAYQSYVMTGTFLESSPRSGVFYMFRRLRPTLAFTGNPRFDGRDVGVRFLAALCMHPIGFFDGSYAGALVPSDDVIAHLLLMRADEHMFWKRSNQHGVWAPEAGI